MGTEDGQVVNPPEGGEGTPAPAGTPNPPAAGTGEPSGDVEIPRFFGATRTEPEPEDIDRIDPTKLPPELLKTYKQIQAAATRKFQAAADLRKQADSDRMALLEERQRWVEKVAAGSTAPAGEQPSDPLAKVKELREQGLHDEADRLLVEISERQAEQRLKPLENEARTNAIKSQFREVVSDAMSLPVVGRYKSEVEQVFDSQNPDIKAFRQLIFSNPNALPLVKPLLYLLATEQHAMALEKNWEKAVQSEVKLRLEKEVKLASGSPTRLVPGSTTSRDLSTPREPDIRKAMLAAKASM